jgi:hypothetical protein
MSDTGSYSQDIIALHQAAHQQMREEIAGLDSAALNWTPGPETSSIGVIITHALGTESEMLRNLLRIPTNRNRDDEFIAQVHEREALEQKIASAEKYWEELAPNLGESELRTLVPRPSKPIPQSGLFWLVRNFGHLREHIAQIQLTKQLYRMRES